ncbi:putative salt-induced outer membrane protein [Thiohalomonas denitrificans]|uniref:Putative salt-induced outer membrane protein n=1 Tax=Thiohalomonas denitrificans TaxID=415747 RepID=A0A1G5Q4H7_9GAMM|nr:putative salt-induced outer membrane protein [Thiohalomonas denitrificans]
MRAGVFLVLGAAQASWAQEAGTGSSGGWSGEAEVGFMATSGNSETESFNARVVLQNELFPWRHDSRLETLRSSDEDQTTAERYLFAHKTDYRFDENSYLFGTLRYEDDRFSGYDYRVSETVGYGRRVYETPDLSLDLEAGIGGRHSLLETSDERDDELIVRGAGSLEWEISPFARFTEELFIESGDENTFTESISALKLKINGNLATKLSYTVRHSSDVPEDTENTDTIVAVTLVLDFE